MPETDNHTDQQKFALVIPEAYKDGGVDIIISLSVSGEFDQVVIMNPDNQNKPLLIDQLGQGDTLTIPSFTDVGCSHVDLWPTILSLHDEGVIIETLDIGFNSAMPDGDMVMFTIDQVVNSQRQFYQRKSSKDESGVLNQQTG